MTEVLSHCQITLSGDITKDSVRQVIIDVDNMVEQGAPEITICIDSLGGEARPGFELYSFIADLPVPVNGIVTGRAESMALVVLQACHKRLIVREATILVHHISTLKVHKRAPLHVKIAVQGVKASYEDMLISLILEKTELDSWDLVKSFLDAGANLSAEEALKFGFVDGIIDA